MGDKVFLRVARAGPGYTATSTTSLLIGLGAKTFVTQTGLAYSVGARVRASSAANTANYMEGLVTAYDPAATNFTVNVDTIGGAGTKTDWNINLAGNAGIAVYTFKGAYAGGSAYAINDVVTYAGSSYVSIQPGTGHQPDTSPLYWTLLASKGDIGLTGATGPGYLATSVTALTIATGAKAFTTQAGLAYSAGSRVRAVSAADATKYMEGLVASYIGTTLTLTVDTTGGAGTPADWNLSLAGYTPRLIVAAGAPGGGTGNDGDLYINSTTWDVYGPKAAGAWGAIVGNIKGATGGAAVPRGAYNAGTTYDQFDGVADAGIPYLSLQSANTGNTPVSSPAFWYPLTGGTGLTTDEFFDADPGATTFTPAVAPTTSSLVFRNGVKMRRGAAYDYDISGANVVFTYGLEGGDVIEVLQ